jgi:hypothetical protein
MKYDIRVVRAGEEQALLDGAYEPFSVVSHDTSYWFYNTSLNMRELERQNTDYIYLRKPVEEAQ